MVDLSSAVDGLKFRVTKRAWLVTGLGLLASGALFWALQSWLPEDLNVSWGDRTWEFADKEALVLLALLPLLAVASAVSLTGLPWQQRVLSFLLRCGLLVALALGLARPSEASEETKICALTLVDVSQSVSDESLELVRERLAQLHRAKGENDELRLLAFGEKARPISLTTDAEGRLIVPELSVLRSADQGKATDIQGAIEMAAAFARADCVPRYFLFSDGIETRGDALSALSGAGDSTTRLSVHAPSKEPPSDVAIADLEIPPGVRLGEPFDVRVTLSATTRTRGTLRLYQGEMLNGLDSVRQVELVGGRTTESFPSVVRVAGDMTYRAEFVPEGEDLFEENNRYRTSLEVPGPPRILLVDGRPDQATYLAQALVAQQLDVDVRQPSALPRSRAELSHFDFVILSDVPYSQMSRSTETLLIEYVRGGGGLLFAGGEAGYGPGGWDSSVLKRILPVTMDSRKERETPGVAMALVIDRSGSMTGLPLSMAKEACNATVGVLAGNDLIEVIAFDSRPNRYVKMQPARYRSRIASSVARIQPGGGTEIFNSMDMAYQDLSVVEARKKHIILLTDGNASSDGIYELASTAFAEGITITSVGLGTGVNQSLLQMIAEAGGGRFHQAEEPTRLPRIFTRETEMISKKATLDDWFPVQVVGPAEFLEGVPVRSAPLLRGYTSTQLGPAPAQAILASDRGEPILARRPVGLGWTLAWTSDLKTRWAVDWLKWGSFGRFVAQMVRKHQVRDDTEVRPMTVARVGQELVARVEAYDARENFDNSLRGQLSVRLISSADESAGSDPAREQLVPFSKVAPGLYEARAPLRHFGSYALKGTFTTNAQGESAPAGVSYGSLSLPYPEEFAKLEPRGDRLAQWAEVTGGHFEPRPEQFWSAQGDVVTAKRARQSDFIWLAIALFFADLLVRRVRLFDRDFQKALRGVG